MANFSLIAERVALVLEYLGVLLVMVGAVSALIELAKRTSLTVLRRAFAERIILALEFIIAADIILATIASTQEDLVKLGAVVLIRLVLGYSLKREIIQESA